MEVKKERPTIFCPGRCVGTALWLISGTAPFIRIDSQASASAASVLSRLNLYQRQKRAVNKAHRKVFLL